MEWDKWKPWYEAIAETLGLNQEQDQNATDLLSELIKDKAIEVSRLRDEVKNKNVIVLGAGPSLEEDLLEILASGLDKHCIFIAADGATSALLSIAKRTANVVVTDLDGRINDLLRADELGSLMTVHAHGDNIEALRKYVVKFSRIIGTTQVKPRLHVYNFGGFTDGDRCAFLAEEMGAKSIILAGMDFGFKVGKYSKPHLTMDSEASEVKRKKLKIAKKLIEWLATWANAEIFNITNRGKVRLSEVRGISCEELVEVL